MLCQTVTVPTPSDADPVRKLACVEIVVSVSLHASVVEQMEMLMLQPALVVACPIVVWRRKDRSRFCDTPRRLPERYLFLVVCD